MADLADLFADVCVNSWRSSRLRCKTTRRVTTRMSTSSTDRWRRLRLLAGSVDSPSDLSSLKPTIFASSTTLSRPLPVATAYVSCTSRERKVRATDAYVQGRQSWGAGVRAPQYFAKGPCINRAPPIIKLQHVLPCQSVIKIMKCLYV